MGSGGSCLQLANHVCDFCKVTSPGFGTAALSLELLALAVPRVPRQSSDVQHDCCLVPSRGQQTLHTQHGIGRGKDHGRRLFQACRPMPLSPISPGTSSQIWAVKPTPRLRRSRLHDSVSRDLLCRLDAKAGGDPRYMPHQPGKDDMGGIDLEIDSQVRTCPVLAFNRPL